MKVVILAGGLGTRISEESYLKPKPMIPSGLPTNTAAATCCALVRGRTISPIRRSWSACAADSRPPADSISHSFAIGHWPTGCVG